MNVSSIGHYGGECSEPIDLGPHRTGASRGAHSEGRGGASGTAPKQEVIGVLPVLVATPADAKGNGLPGEAKKGSTGDPPEAPAPGPTGCGANL